MGGRGTRSGLVARGPEGPTEAVVSPGELDVNDGKGGACDYGPSG